MTLRVGLIGLSEGNGHPYSWAAICNGYSPEHMEACEFPMIPRYLEEQPWPEARIPGVEVTCIWTQDSNLSMRIAKASRIAHVVDDPTMMMGRIDALLLARDDADNHLAFAAPFLEAGIPVYIDKPVAVSLNNMNELYRRQRYDGQIFTCSALRYAKEFTLSSLDRERLGKIKHLQATTPKSWEKYALHIIEPTVQIAESSADLSTASVRVISKTGRAVSIAFHNGITADLNAFGYDAAAPLSIRIYGELSWHDLLFKDSFSAFKSALIDFFDGIRTKTCRSSIEFNSQAISILELGFRM